MRNVKKIRMVHFATSYSIKEAYDNRRSFLTPCSRFPRILPPPKVDYVFSASLSTAAVLLASFTLLFLYKVNKHYT